MLRIEPPPRVRIGLTASCRHRNGARRFTAIIRSQNSSVDSSSEPRAVLAALLTSTSRPPYRSMANCTTWRQTAGSARSPDTNAASCPAAWSCSAFARADATSGPWTTTFAPIDAKRSAIPRPIPETDPVTSVILFGERGHKKKKKESEFS